MFVRINFYYLLVQKQIIKLQPYKIRQHAAVSNKPAPVRVTIADDAAAVFISPVTHN